MNAHEQALALIFIHACVRVAIAQSLVSDIPRLGGRARPTPRSRPTGHCRTAPAANALVLRRRLLLLLAQGRLQLGQLPLPPLPEDDEDYVEEQPEDFEEEPVSEAGAENVAEAPSEDDSNDDTEAVR